MMKPKHNYACDKFYEDVFAFSFQGLTDAEIADGLNLTPEVFSRMKNGKYEGWNEEENATYGERLSQVLVRGRRKVNSIVRGAYLKGALGGKKIKSITNRFVQEKCVCEGKEKKCSVCGGTGWIQLTDRAISQETEAELPPNMQALSTWLYHHDEEWKNAEVSKVDVTTNGKDIGQQIIFSPTPLTEKDIQEIKDIQSGKKSSDDTGISET